MKKVISLFKRDYEGTRLVYDAVVEGAEWVINGEGSATRKFDGTCCLVKAGKLFKRYEVKKGKTAPEDFVPANDIDPKTGKWQGWRPVKEGPEDQYHREAFSGNEPDGTYELLGPKIQGNPEHFNVYNLIRHGSINIEPVPRTFDGLKEYLSNQDIEGVVWHHPDGKMVKIKKKDFGLKRG